MAYSIRGMFELKLDLSDGIPVYGDAEAITSFTLEVDGAAVDVEPVLEEHSFEDVLFDPDGNELGLVDVPYQVVKSLRAEVTRRFEGTFGEHLEAAQRVLLTAPAEQAIETTLRHLRDVTGHFALDVLGSGMTARYFIDESRELGYWEIHGFTIDLTTAFSVSEKEWAETRRRAETNRRIPLARELLLDAKGFAHRKNYRMALLNAATAAEVLMVRKMAAALPGDDREARSQADRVAKAVGKADAVVFLAYFYELPAASVTLVQDAFNIRNQLLHQERRLVTEQQARDAINAAELMDTLKLRR